MALSTHSDPFVVVALWTGLAALVVTLLLSLQIVRLRIGLRRLEARRQRVLAKWRPVLNAVVSGDTIPLLPSLDPEERLPLLRVWVHLQASMRGSAQTALNELAFRLELDAVARDMLQRGKRSEQLLAVLALGYLRDGKAWPVLLRQAGQTDVMLATQALWALIRIDPQAAADLMTSFFVQQDDWPISRAASILQEARDQAAAALVRTLSELDELDEQQLARGLQLAEALRVNLTTDVLSRALRSELPHVVVAGLRTVSAHEVAGEVRALLGHQDWRVRVQAARALGRIGDRGDAVHLEPLLQDRQWWVRYRAAQALASLPGMSVQDMLALRAGLTDRYAADMLTQVMSEQGLV